jgi:predicted RNase H-like nuclease
MPSNQRELPYKTVGSVIPTSVGWLLASAKLRGATFVPDFPHVFEELHDAIQRRPAFTVVALDAPIGGQAASFSGKRSCDESARTLLDMSVPEARWKDLAFAMAHVGNANGLSGTTYLRERYREIAEVIAPYIQRTVCECLPDLSFYQLNGERPLVHRSDTTEGYDERRALLDKVPGIGRILDATEPGVSRLQLLDAGALLWTARRIAARAAKRVPSLPEWDEHGLRIEILR